MDEIILKPIGHVETAASNEEVRDKERISHIILREELTFGLEGLEEFSHIYVLFWMHETPQDEKKRLTVYPRGRRHLPLKGIYATRTRHRPNPIGLTLVELVEVKGNILSVKGLDAFDRTPVIDIKPFDNWDAVKDPRVPDWWKKLEKERTRP